MSHTSAQTVGSLPPVRRVAPELIHNATPALGWFTDNIVFGEVWERKELSKRDRSFVTLSVLITRYYTPQLTGHFNRALDHGIAPTEIAEMITHLAFYAGWPCAVSAVGVMQEVFTARNIGLEQVTQQITQGSSVYLTTPPAIPDALGNLTQRVLEGDLWQRPELTARDRSLVTVASFAAQSQLDALALHVARALKAGLTAADMVEAMTHLAFYAGWPRATASLAVVNRVCHAGADA